MTNLHKPKKPAVNITFQTRGDFLEFLAKSGLYSELIDGDPAEEYAQVVNRYLEQYSDRSWGVNDSLSDQDMGRLETLIQRLRDENPSLQRPRRKRPKDSPVEVPPTTDPDLSTLTTPEYDHQPPVDREGPTYSMVGLTQRPDFEDIKNRVFEVMNEVVAGNLGRPSSKIRELGLDADDKRDAARVIAREYFFNLTEGRYISVNEETRLRSAMHDVEKRTDAALRAYLGFVDNGHNFLHETKDARVAKALCDLVESTPTRVPRYTQRSFLVLLTEKELAQATGARDDFFIRELPVTNTTPELVEFYNLCRPKVVAAARKKYGLVKEDDIPSTTEAAPALSQRDIATRVLDVMNVVMFTMKEGNYNEIRDKELDAEPHKEKARKFARRYFGKLIGGTYIFGEVEYEGAAEIMQDPQERIERAICSYADFSGKGYNFLASEQHSEERRQIARKIVELVEETEVVSYQRFDRLWRVLIPEGYNLKLDGLRDLTEIHYGENDREKKLELARQAKPILVEAARFHYRLQ